MAHDHETAARLLSKLHRLATEELDSDERVMLGVCLAPTVLAATESQDVAGFAFTPVGDEALGALLQSALQASNLRIVDFEGRRDEPPEPLPHLDLRVGRVLDASPSGDAATPAWTLTVDFGPALGPIEAALPLAGDAPEAPQGRLVVGAVDQQAPSAHLLRALGPTGAIHLLEVPATVTPGTPVTW